MLDRAARFVAVPAIARDLHVYFVDIQSDVLICVHVLVLAFGCLVNRLIHADRLHSGGATRVDGDKHANCSLLGTQL